MKLYNKITWPQYYNFVENIFLARKINLNIGKKQI